VSEKNKDRILSLKEEIKKITLDFTNITDSDKSAAINRLLFLINDEEEWIRRWTTDALGKLGIVEAVQPLSQCLLEDISVKVRREAADALDRIST